MGSFRFPASSMDLSEAFSDMPQPMRTFMKNGFLILSRITQDKFSVLASIAVQAAQSPYRVDVDDAAKQLGINAEEMGALLPSLSFLTTVISNRSEKPEQLVAAAIEADVIPEVARQVVSQFSQTLALQRDFLRNESEKSRLATRVLPSMISFDVAVDIRLHPVKPDFSVPVAIAHVDTDIAHTELWFQMQIGDVEQLIETLQKTAKQMTEAEKLMVKREKA